MTPKDPFLEGTFWDKFWRPDSFGALRGRCPKLPKKHSGGHFQARALKALL